LNNSIINCIKEFIAKHDEQLVSQCVIVKTPYIPFIPKNWNGTLVLAEAQNLSKRYEKYANELNASTLEEQIYRLKNKDNLGVLPWDDNSLKIAVEVGLKQDHTEVAVSNACFWSQRNEDGNNVNPSKILQELSGKLWQELFELLKPKVVVTTGKIAKIIINSSEYSGKSYNLCHPSSNYLSRFSGLIEESDILERFTEISAIDQKFPSWMAKGEYRQNKLFYAMHALRKLKAI